MPNVNLPARGLGLISGNGTLLPSFGLGLGPIADLVTKFIGYVANIGIFMNR